MKSKIKLTSFLILLLILILGSGIWYYGFKENTFLSGGFTVTSIQKPNIITGNEDLTKLYNSVFPCSTWLKDFPFVDL